MAKESSIFSSAIFSRISRRNSRGRDRLRAAALGRGLLGARIADIGHRHAQEVGHRHAGDHRRVLERQEEALARPLVRRPLEDVLALVADAALGDLVARVAGDDVGQRALAGAVRPHQRVDLALVDGQVDALEDLLASIAACRFSISNIGVVPVPLLSLTVTCYLPCAAPSPAPLNLNSTSSRDRASRHRLSAHSLRDRSRLRWPGCRALAAGTDAGEDRVVTGDVESALLRGDVARDQGHRDVDVEQHAALQAVHVVVPLDAPVVAAGLVGERQLLDQAVLRQQVQRAIDRAVGDARIAPPHALEDLARGQVALRPAHLVEHFRPLRCVSKSLPRHRTTTM